METKICINDELKNVPTETLLCWESLLEYSEKVLNFIRKKESFSLLNCLVTETSKNLNSSVRLEFKHGSESYLSLLKYNSMIINRMREFIPNVIYTFQTEVRNSSSLTILENVEGESIFSSGRLGIGSSSINNYIFQLSVTLYMLYTKLGMTVKNLHPDIVIVRKMNSPTRITYNINDKNYTLLTDEIITIVDFTDVCQISDMYLSELIRHIQYVGCLFRTPLIKDLMSNYTTRIRTFNDVISFLLSRDEIISLFQ